MTHRDRFLPTDAPPPGLFWETWYQAASHEQRDQALALARQHGALPAHQLPDLNSVLPPQPSCLLSALLANQITPTPLPKPPPFTPCDVTLDTYQQRAVRCALHTPDVALIAGPAGSGKSRTVAALLEQVLGRGETVLFVSAKAGGTHYALGRLSPEAQAGTILLGEAPESLRPMTLAQRVDAVRESSHLGRGQQAVEELRQLVQAIREESGRLVAKQAALAALVAGLNAERAGLLNTLQADQANQATPLGAAFATLAEVVAGQDGPLAARAEAVQGQQEQERAAAEQRRTRRETLQPLADALNAGRWWSAAWWQALFAGDVSAQLQVLHSEDEQGQARAEALARELDELTAARGGIAEQAGRLRQELIEVERDRREASLQVRCEEVAHEQQWAEAAWKGCWSRLLTEVPAFSEQGREQGQTQLQVLLEREEAAAAARKNWADALREAMPFVGPLLLRNAGLVAGSVEEVINHVGDRDFLVVEDAQQLSEEQLLTLAQRARRWVFIGEPALPAVPLPGRPPRPPVSAFHRLWQRLHPDPRRHATHWHRVRGRLVAKLRAIAEAGLSHWEPLYDRPEVEVCIARPAGEEEDRVCEVSFPEETPITEARAFIRRELEELALEPASPAAYWCEEDGKPVLSLCVDQGAEVKVVPVIDGIDEHLVPCARLRECPGWHTARLVFDPAQGWDEARAQEWAEKALALRDLGRTAYLGRSHRAVGPLGAFLSECVYRGSVPAPAEHVTFVPVPTPETHTGPINGRTRPARGANLEIDLGALRGPHPALDPHVQGRLPGGGLINPAEAEALVHWLTVQLAEESFRDELLNWHARTGQPALAVLSTSTAQVALLEVLLADVLNGLPAEVASVEQFRGRECYASLISLVRSQGTEAVGFSEHPDDLVCLLTRATTRVVLFGDPGSMLRRSQWYGPLGSQDDQVAPQEQALMLSLTGCWPEVMAAASASGPSGRSSVRSTGMRESSSV